MPGPIDIALKWFDHGRGLELPKQQSAGAAGVDLLAALGISEVVSLAPASGHRPLRLCYGASRRPRSAGQAPFGARQQIRRVGAQFSGHHRRGLSGVRWKVVLINLGDEIFEIRRGDRIAQLVVAPVSALEFSETETLDATERGASGFGSTGR